MRRLSPDQALDRAKNIIDLKGGTYLSGTYPETGKRTQATSYVSVQCEFGHVWDVNFGGLFAGSWCPVCVGRVPAREQTEKAKKIVSEKGGVIATGEYVTIKSRLLIRCEDGHEWATTYEHLLNRDQWCAKCYHATVHEFFHHPDRSYDPKQQMKRACEIISDRKGVLISGTYNGAKSRLDVRCEAGHGWNPTFSGLFSGKWCIECHFTRNVSKNPLIIRLKELGREMIDLFPLTESKSGDWRLATDGSWVDLVWELYYHLGMTLAEISEEISVERNVSPTTLSKFLRGHLQYGEIYRKISSARSLQAIGAEPIHMDIGEGISLRREGLTYPQIAEKLGVTVTSAHRKLRNEPGNVVRPRDWNKGRVSPRRKIDPAQAKELWLIQKKSTRLIAEIFGATKTAVTQTLKTVIPNYTEVAKERRRVRRP